MEVSSYRISYKRSSSAVRSTCSLSPSSLKHCRVESESGFANRIQEESGHSGFLLAGPSLPADQEFRSQSVKAKKDQRT